MRKKPVFDGNTFSPIRRRTIIGGILKNECRRILLFLQWNCCFIRKKTIKWEMIVSDIVNPKFGAIAALPQDGYNTRNYCGLKLQKGAL